MKSDPDASHRLPPPRRPVFEPQPKDRAVQIPDALREIAGLSQVADHPNIKQISGDMAGWSRLRVGAYRAILHVTVIEIGEVLFVDAIGPRGDIYKG